MTLNLLHNLIGTQRTVDKVKLSLLVQNKSIKIVLVFDQSLCLFENLFQFVFSYKLLHYNFLMGANCVGKDTVIEETWH